MILGPELSNRQKFRSGATDRGFEGFSNFWVFRQVFNTKGKVSFKIETANANISPTELQVPPEHFKRPREPENLLSV